MNRTTPLKDALLLAEIFDKLHPLFDAYGWASDEHAWTNAVSIGGGTVFCSFASPNLSFWALLALDPAAGGRARYSALSLPHTLFSPFATNLSCKLLHGYVSGLVAVITIHPVIPIMTSEGSCRAAIQTNRWTSPSTMLPLRPTRVTPPASLSRRSGLHGAHLNVGLYQWRGVWTLCCLNGFLH
jgi:hypothetical protein